MPLLLVQRASWWRTCANSLCTPVFAEVSSTVAWMMSQFKAYTDSQITQLNRTLPIVTFPRVQESRNGIREVVDTAKHREETAMELGVRQQNLIKPASNQRNGRRQECRATTIVRQLCRSNVYPTKVLKKDRFTKHFSQASQSRKCV